MSEKEKYHVTTANLEGTDLQKGTITKPILEIVYENINKEIFRSTYDIKLEKRDDKKYRIGEFINLYFKTAQ